MVDDPADATSDLLKAQLELVFDDATVSQILGLLGGTTVYATRAPIILDSNFPAQVSAVSSKLAYIPSDGGYWRAVTCDGNSYCLGIGPSKRSPRLHSFGSG